MCVCVCLFNLRAFMKRIDGNWSLMMIGGKPSFPSSRFSSDKQHRDLRRCEWLQHYSESIRNFFLDNYEQNQQLRWSCLGEEVHVLELKSSNSVNCKRTREGEKNVLLIFLNHQSESSMWANRYTWSHKFEQWKTKVRALESDFVALLLLLLMALNSSKRSKLIPAKSSSSR